MKEVIKPFKYSQSGKMIPIILLGTILFITLGAWVYNGILEKQNAEIQVSIKSSEAKINELEGQKPVVIASLLKVHKKTLDNMTERSQITKYLDHVNTTADFYKFEMRGFQMSGGKIQSSASFVSNGLGSGPAYKKVNNFISGYRNSKESLLDLDFISGVQSVDNQIKFPTTFTLK